MSHVQLSRVSKFASAAQKLLRHGMADVEIGGVRMSQFLKDVSSGIALAAKDNDVHRVNRKAHVWLCTLNAYIQVSVATFLSSDAAEFSVRVSLEG